MGKSTTTLPLVIALRREREQRVGVLAIDPSSPYHGGALLGDRVRMQMHATDDRGIHQVDGDRAVSSADGGRYPAGGTSSRRDRFRRRASSRPSESGRPRSTSQPTADTTVVLLAPGMGDGIQAAKAGLIEVADLLVVNKADRDGADRPCETCATCSPSGGGTRSPAHGDQRSCALLRLRDEGIGEVIAAIEKHGEWMTANGEIDRRRRARAAV